MVEPTTFRKTPDGQFRMVAEVRDGKLLSPQEAAERYRKIRQSQPQLSPEEMRAQLENNRAEHAARLTPKS